MWGAIKGQSSLAWSDSQARSLCQSFGSQVYPRPCRHKNQTKPCIQDDVLSSEPGESPNLEDVLLLFSWLRLQIRENGRSILGLCNPSFLRRPYAAHRLDHGEWPGGHGTCQPLSPLALTWNAEVVGRQKAWNRCKALTRMKR